MTTYLTTAEAERREQAVFNPELRKPGEQLHDSAWPYGLHVPYGHPQFPSPPAIHGDSSPMPLGSYLSRDSVGRMALHTQTADTRFTFLPLHRYICVDGLFPPQAPGEPAKCIAH